MTIRFGSVCSGIEAASVAWLPLGWECAWTTEIEPFPCAVLKHHYPDVPNYGDIRLLPERILSGEIEAPEILCGGTPCQSFSVSGKRQSMKDDRGNLSLVFCEIFNAIRLIRQQLRKSEPIFFWENVPGVLSTWDNAFGQFLQKMVRANDRFDPPIGGWKNAGLLIREEWQISWRTLNSEYFGVPQRRRRVFVIGSARDGFDPCKVLFEQSSLQGHPTPRRKKKKDTTAFIETSFGNYRESSAAGTLRESGGAIQGGSETLIIRAFNTNNTAKIFTPTKIASTITANGTRFHGGGSTLVVHTNKNLLNDGVDRE